MTSLTDPNFSDLFTSAIAETHNNHLKSCEEMIDMTMESCQAHTQSVQSALGTCLKKCDDDLMRFETIQTFKTDLLQKNVSLKEKKHAISEMMTEIQQKEMQKDAIIQKIEKLGEDQVKRKELIESEKKANKNRLKNLQKTRVVFQDHLGMEIRKIRGEKLQFVFWNINPSDQDSAYVVTMGIKEDGSYQIVSSDPAIECLPLLESRLQETNNMAAFLANVRKEFISQIRS